MYCLFYNQATAVQLFFSTFFLTGQFFFCFSLRSFHFSNWSLHKRMTFQFYHCLTITNPPIYVYCITLYSTNYCTLFSYNNGEHCGYDIPVVVHLHDRFVLRVRISTRSIYGFAFRPKNEVCEYYIITNYLVYYKSFLRLNKLCH